MPADTPLLTVLALIVGHTPRYVWGILAALIVLGGLQMRDHVLSRGRLLLAPIGLGAFSLWGATLAFGARPEIVACWALGTALAVAANLWLRWPRSVRVEADGRFALAGSPWPLMVMMAVFALRYTVAVTLAFHPEWAREPAFSLSMALVYGALSGLFAGRALRILRSGAVTARLAAA